MKFLVILAALTACYAGKGGKNSDGGGDSDGGGKKPGVPGLPNFDNLALALLGRHGDYDYDAPRRVRRTVVVHDPPVTQTLIQPELVEQPVLIAQCIWGWPATNTLGQILDCAPVGAQCPFGTSCVASNTLWICCPNV
jgi:hypothetical protein